MLRTVQDQKGMTWICLELPEVPVERREAAGAMAADTVAIECNSGAERVIALVPNGWDDDMPDSQLAGIISAHLSGG